ncbi:hypothetical protein SUDANB43_04811 [Streptomyces sp. enrichment culture]
MRLPRRHPGRDEYERLRAAGVARRVAARRAGVNERTAKDWDWGVKKTATTRTYADGRRVDYTTGTVTMSGVTTPPVGLSALDKQLHSRLLTLAEREKIRDLRAAGQSLRAIGPPWDGRQARSSGRSTRTRAARATSPTRPTGGGSAETPAQGPPAAARGTAAPLRPGPTAPAVVTGPDLPRSGEGASRRREHAGERGNDLPGAVLPGPRRPETGSAGSHPAPAGPDANHAGTPNGALHGSSTRW